MALDDFTNLNPGSPTYPFQGGSAASSSSIPSSAGSGDANYWLPIWSGEVLNAYDQHNIFEGLVSSDTIQSGTTKRFPITGTVKHKAIWLAGEELGGSENITQTPGWFDISLDSRPMASFFDLDDVSLMLTQWSYSAEMARQAGLALANVKDKQIVSMIAQAAFTANREPYSTSYAGMSNPSHPSPLLPDAAFNYLGNRFATTANRQGAALLFLEYLEKYMVNLESVDVDTGGVYAAVTPQAFHDIRALGITRKDTGTAQQFIQQPMFVGNAEQGGLGMGLNQNTFGLRETLSYMGVTIVKSNHLAIGGNGIAGCKITAGATAGNPIQTALGLTASGSIGDLGDAKYNFDMAKQKGTTGATANDYCPVVGLIWQSKGIASLRLQGLKVETIKDVRRGTTFTVASMMGGAGILRPEVCATVQGDIVNA